MAKGKLAIGLDIGSTSVKMIQLKETRRRGEVVYSLQSFGMKPLPPEAIVDDALMNSTAIVQAIQELVAELRSSRRTSPIGVSGHSVIIKKISDAADDRRRSSTSPSSGRRSSTSPST